MTRQTSPERREDEGRMWLFVYAAIVAALILAGIVWQAAEWVQR